MGGREASLRGFQHPVRSISLGLLLLCIISFGLLIPWLGFYWDDWPTIWFLHLFGQSGFKEVFAVDRPALGWLFTFTASLVGQNPLFWQIFGLLTRWAACLAFWWVLRMIWPKNLFQVTLAAFLFAVYPGFQQQFISVTYSHDWIIMAGFFLSLGLMIWAVRKPGWFWPLILASWLLSAYAMFADEYYFGLELLRPILLWLVLSETASNTWVKVRRIAIIWIPYLVIMGLFLYWRLYVLPSPRGQLTLLSQLSGNPFSAILQFSQKILSDIGEVSLTAWARVFDYNIRSQLGLGLGLVCILVVSGAAFVTIYFLWKLASSIESRDTTQVPRSRWALQAILVGGAALLVAGVPFWSTDLPIMLRFPWDRFTLPMMFGSSLLFAGLIVIIFKSQRIQYLLVGILVGLAAGMHFQTAVAYRDEWFAQKQFFWQLVWRAPEIEPGTVFLTTYVPFLYYTDNSLSAPLNWIYASDDQSRQMPYMFYDLEMRLEKGINQFERTSKIQQPYRATTFTGTAEKAIGLYFSPITCLKILDPVRDKEYWKLTYDLERNYVNYVEGKPDIELMWTAIKGKVVEKALAFSSLKNINANEAGAARPPEHIFGPEPKPGWCTYYEKAELARVSGNWARVADLADQAFALNMPLKKFNAPELFTYIEGYAMTKQWDKAADISEEAYHLAPSVSDSLCKLWDDIALQTRSDPDGQKVYPGIRTQLQCK